MILGDNLGNVKIKRGILQGDGLYVPAFVHLNFSTAFLVLRDEKAQ